MNAQFAIHLAKARRKTPRAVLEFTSVATWSQKPDRYAIALAGYEAMGYKVVPQTPPSAPQEYRDCYMTNNKVRINLSESMFGADEQHWAFQTEEEARTACKTAREMTQTFCDLGSTKHSNYWEVHFKHIPTDTNVTFLWRKDPIFPNLWKEAP